MTDELLQLFFRAPLDLFDGSQGGGCFGEALSSIPLTGR